MTEAPLHLVRPRLLEALRRSARAPLSVVASPAGFGKTVLLGQWAAEHRGPPLVWLTLRPGDDAPRVAVKLWGAAVRLGADTGPLTPGWVPRSASTLGPVVLDRFLARVGAVGEAVVVVDGLDTPLIPSLSGELVSMAERRPRNVRVVVTSRAPSHRTYHLAHLADEVVALDAGDLAFTGDEAVSLVARVSGRHLSADQVERLLASTEGWAVGIHVAAIALRGPMTTDEVLETLGRERHLSAFLVDEVLDRQAPAVGRFLLRASVMDTLTARSCRVIAEQPAAASMLRSLEEAGSFVRRLPSGDRFVMHPLFREVLRHELRVREPGDEAAVLARAAAWHLQAREPEQAASYLVQAEDWAGLLGLVDVYGAELLRRGRAEEMLQWLDAVPVDSPERRRQVALRRAYLLRFLGNPSRAEQTLRGIDPRELTTGERVLVDVFRSVGVLVDTSPRLAVAAADAALDAIDRERDVDVPRLLGVTSPANLRLIAGGSRARALWHLGDVGEARRSFAELVGVPGGDALWRVYVFSAWSLLEAWAGDLGAAEQHAHHARSLAARIGLVAGHPAMIDALLAMAHVARCRHELAEADELLTAAASAASQVDLPVELTVHAVERARWCLAMGRPDRGLAELDALREVGLSQPRPVIDRRLQALEVRLLVALGDLEAARLAFNARGDGCSAEMSAAGVELAVARRDAEAALELLDAWTSSADDVENRLEHELWAAVIELERGHRRQAYQRAERVVADAEVEGHVQVLLDAGRPAERLLRALRHNASRPFLERVLASEPSEAERLASEVRLSQRELEVVRYLPTPLSSAEIATQLYISLNTLKTHLRTIYRKLGVSGRDEAIRRAEDLGIA